MRFSYEGKTFNIRFQRDHKLVRNRDGVEIPSKFPYTTCFIEEVKPDPNHPDRWLTVSIYREATCGCHFREKRFSSEKGRCRALAQICRTVPVEMKRKIFDTYLNR